MDATAKTSSSRVDSLLSQSDAADPGADTGSQDDLLGTDIGLARAAERFSFDEPMVLPEVQVRPLDLTEVINQATAEAVSKQSGIPQSRTAEVLTRLQSEPQRLSQPTALSASEQTIVSSAVQTARAAAAANAPSLPQALGSNPPSDFPSMDENYARLRQFAAQIEAAPRRVQQNIASDSFPERLRSIARRLAERDDVTIVTDNTGKISHLNRAALFAIGFDASESNLFPQEVYRVRLENALRTAPSGRSSAWPLPRRDGTVVLCDLVGVTISDESTQAKLAAVYVIRTPTPPPLDPLTRQQIPRIMDGLSLYVPLLLQAQSTTSSDSDYQSAIRRLLDRLESLVNLPNTNP